MHVDLLSAQPPAGEGAAALSSDEAQRRTLHVTSILDMPAVTARRPLKAFLGFLRLRRISQFHIYSTAPKRL